MEDYFENSYTKMFIKNGILYVTYPYDLRITMEIAKQCLAARLEFSKGLTYPMLADTRTIKVVDSDARAYLSGGDAIKGISAGAFVIKTRVEKFMGNVFLKINKPPLPARLFIDEKEALKWLDNYKNA